MPILVPQIQAGEEIDVLTWRRDFPLRECIENGSAASQVATGIWEREKEQALSGFGLCATDAREPRQVRKEATVASLSVCRRPPEVWPI